jgi:hypothetical protein
MLPLSFTLASPAQTAAWLGLLLIVRANNLVLLTGFKSRAAVTFTDSSINSLGCLLLFAAACVGLLLERKSQARVS